MGRRKLVRIMLEAATIDLSLTNQQKETPIDIATRKGHEEIAAMIRHPPPKPSKLNNTEVVEAEINLDTIDKAKDSDVASKKSAGGNQKSKSRSARHKKRLGLRAADPKWSPYGCHYYPDLNEFPAPNVASLPEEPLSSGEQYFLDLAGNIKKGPVGNGSTCYCAPFIHR